MYNIGGPQADEVMQDLDGSFPISPLHPQLSLEEGLLPRRALKFVTVLPGSILLSCELVRLLLLSTLFASISREFDVTTLFTKLLHVSSPIS
jgi:hypothetical protein